MREVFKKFPTAARFVQAILLGVMALVVTGLIGMFIHIPFIDVALLILVTWFMYRTEGKSLKEIGLNLNAKHLLFLALGILLGIAALAIENFIRMMYTGEHWSFNPSINNAALWK